MAVVGQIVPEGQQSKEGFHALRRTTEGMLYYTKIDILDNYVSFEQKSLQLNVMTVKLKVSFRRTLSIINGKWACEITEDFLDNYHIVIYDYLSLIENHWSGTIAVIEKSAEHRLV